MQSRLKELKNKIFFGKHSDEEWKKINEEVDEIWDKVSEEDKQEFVESGAGGLLGQIMEYMD